MKSAIEYHNSTLVTSVCKALSQFAIHNKIKNVQNERASYFRALTLAKFGIEVLRKNCQYKIQSRNLNYMAHEYITNDKLIQVKAKIM